MRPAPVIHQPGPRHILITQCLQNDLFGKTGCKIGLPETVADEMLLGMKRHEERRLRNGYATGPLGLFLAATIGERAKATDGVGTLHVVNIRDWHKPGPSYDDERRISGRHCEAGTPGAAYLTGLERYLDPAGSAVGEPAQYFAAGSVRVYHIHSDTLFDFRPEERSGRKFSASELEDLLEVIIGGTEEELAQL